jgi:hypothetical protein
MILTLQPRNTANIVNVANISTFSKEANFITLLRFLTPSASVTDSARRPPPALPADSQQVGGGRSTHGSTRDYRIMTPPRTPVAVKPHSQLPLQGRFVLLEQMATSPDADQLQLPSFEQLQLAVDPSPPPPARRTINSLVGPRSRTNPGFAFSCCLLRTVTPTGFAVLTVFPPAGGVCARAWSNALEVTAHAKTNTKAARAHLPRYVITVLLLMAVLLLLPRFVLTSRDRADLCAGSHPHRDLRLATGAPLRRVSLVNLRQLAGVTTSGFHPPITTKASMVRDASTSTVSKEASLMMPSASYPAATVSDSRPPTKAMRVAPR